MTDLKPTDVVTVEDAEAPSVAELLDQAEAFVNESISFRLKKCDRKEVARLCGAVCRTIDAVRALDARLRKAGL